MYIPIGGIEQWLHVGGDAPDHPVLLYLHGGPGGSASPLSGAFKPWEEHFRVALWDQRGAGAPSRGMAPRDVGRYRSSA